MPNYQGSILDQVAQNNRTKFARDVMIYLGLSVGLGFFGALCCGEFSATVIDQPAQQGGRVRMMQKFGSLR